MARVQSIALPLELRSVLAALTEAEVADEQRWMITLLRQNGQAVVTLLWRMLGSEQDVLDAYQTAVCQLTGRGREGVKSNLGGYFYRVAMNAGIGILRRRQMQRRQWPALVDAHVRREADSSAGRSGEQVFDQREMLDRMRRAISELPPHLGDVVMLRDLGELPYQQVATILGIRETTARLYRHQAITRLAGLIGQEAVE